MTIYSPIPLDQIFDRYDKVEEPLQEIQCNGITMEVRPLNENSAQIVRLISSDPQHFLNPQLQPGTRIHYKPFLQTQ